MTQGQDRTGVPGADPHDSEDWDRLGPAVGRQDRSDLMSDVRPETGAMRAVPPSAEPWADQRSSSKSVEVPEPAGSLSTARRPAPQGQTAPPGTLRLITRLLVALAVPLGLLAVSARLVASPVFLWIEYHRPGFPEDPYGFGSEDRMALGAQGVDYILNWAPARFLGDVRTDNGLPWFRAEEISHMTDVKYVMQIGLALGLLCVVAAVVTWFLRSGVDSVGLIRAVVRGAWATIGLIVVLAVVAAVAWQWFFSTFHALFFADGTWTFSLSDTLIRLYPTQFWIDAAATVGVLTLLGAVVVIWCGRRALRRRHSR